MSSGQGYFCSSQPSGGGTLYTVPTGSVRGSLSTVYYLQEYDGTSWVTTYDTWMAYKLNSPVSLPNGITVEVEPGDGSNETKFYPPIDSSLIYVRLEWNLQCVIIEEDFSESTVTRSDLSSLSTTTLAIQLETYGGADDHTPQEGGINTTLGIEDYISWRGKSAVDVHGFAILPTEGPNYTTITGYGTRTSYVDGDERIVNTYINEDDTIYFYNRPS